MTSGHLLAIDTATSHAVVAIGLVDGTPVARRTWEAGRGHSESLLPTLESLLRDIGVRVNDRGAVSGIAVGIGPGSFTGLRVGLATAKVLAYSLGVPIVGVDTPEWLAVADASATPATAGVAGGRNRSAELVVLMPAGPSGLYVTVVDAGGAGAIPETIVEAQAAGRDDAARLIAGRDVLAVDLDDTVAGPAAAERGRNALDGAGDALLAIAARRLASGDVDDAAELVPAYVTLPRGVREVAEGVAWSPALR